MGVEHQDGFAVSALLGGKIPGNGLLCRVRLSGPPLEAGEEAKGEYEGYPVHDEKTNEFLQRTRF